MECTQIFIRLFALVILFLAGCGGSNDAIEAPAVPLPLVTPTIVAKATPVPTVQPMVTPTLAPSSSFGCSPIEIKITRTSAPENGVEHEYLEKVTVYWPETLPIVMSQDMTVAYSNGSFKRFLRVETRQEMRTYDWDGVKTVDQTEFFDPGEVAFWQCANEPTALSFAQSLESEMLAQTELRRQVVVLEDGVILREYDPKKFSEVGRANKGDYFILIQPGEEFHSILLPNGDAARISALYTVIQP